MFFSISGQSQSLSGITRPLHGVLQGMQVPGGGGGLPLLLLGPTGVPSPTPVGVADRHSWINVQQNPNFCDQINIDVPMLTFVACEYVRVIIGPRL